MSESSRMITEDEFYTSDTEENKPEGEKCGACSVIVDPVLVYENDGICHKWRHNLSDCDRCGKNLCKSCRTDICDDVALLAVYCKSRKKCKENP